ncbi:LysE family translocator [Sphingopyxis panaciterrulae]|uniref:Threonine/homoserine/homoserine lactone efflux protein n=1 Tax=Sphingopyxis panaciterrulae TaxID=462372 RepID=A0A7W9B4J0_9SPHN|nr:LysE family translocator [Sphingopyxis panaciterrulae]MBB5706164.1 threonine/homoserine/homoserine lactone efflux protein [Sphingopyxis panaciterrulae]
MEQTTLAALSAFAFATSITPGPNNMMLMASGANFGLRRTVPHALGVGIGFTLMIVLVGVGLMELFDLFPALNLILKVVSVVYLLWLAWKIANAAAPETGGGARGKPMSFVQAMLFQWVNPKAWSMALTAMALYAPDRNLAAVALVAAVFGVINLPSTGLWAVMGQALRGWLSSAARLRAFNWTMAALLVGSLALLI